MKYPLNDMIVLFFILQILNTCLICYEEGFNITLTRCCNTHVHKHLFKMISKRAVFFSYYSLVHCFQFASPYILIVNCIDFNFLSFTFGFISDGYVKDSQALRGVHFVHVHLNSSTTNIETDERFISRLNRVRNQLKETICLYIVYIMLFINESFIHHHSVINFTLFLFSVLQFSHPDTDVDQRCLACIYFRTGLNAIQKHEFAFTVSRTNRGTLTVMPR